VLDAGVTTCHGDACRFTRIAVVPEFCSSVLFPKIMVRQRAPGVRACVRAREAICDAVVLPWQGISLANEMLIMGKKLTAAEAKACGFISEVFAPEELLAEVCRSTSSGEPLPPLLCLAVMS
jgi:enoyl-CoA hydratase/carnithine racemase